MLLLLLACALALGGWVLVGPALATRTPSIPEPPIDIETPASRAQLDAVIALARTPDQPFFVFALDAPVAASSAVDGKGRCGEDDVAVYREPAPDPEDGAIHMELAVPDPDGVVRRQPGELRPAGVGYTGAMRRIDAALRASPEPFDRAVADSLDLGQITPPVVRLDALVQDAQAVSDPRVYGLAYAACNAWALPYTAASREQSSCARLSATEWARRDPGNGQPWIWALDHADKTGDVAGQQEALRGLLASSRFELRFHGGAAAVARLRMPDADLTAQSVASMQALAFTPGPVSALTQRCRNGADSDAELATTCSRIALTMYEHSDSFLSRNIGGSLHRIVTGDSGWLDRAHQEQGRLGRLVADSTAAVEGSPCGEARALLKAMVRFDAVGEIPLAQEAARAASQPPAHATP